MTLAVAYTVKTMLIIYCRDQTISRKKMKITLRLEPSSLELIVSSSIGGVLSPVDCLTVCIRSFMS